MLYHLLTYIFHYISLRSRAIRRLVFKSFCLQGCKNMQNYPKLSKKIENCNFPWVFDMFYIFFDMFLSFCLQGCKKMQKISESLKNYHFPRVFDLIFFSSYHFACRDAKICKNYRTFENCHFPRFFNILFMYFFKSFCLQGCKNMQKFSQKIENCNVPRVFLHFLKFV